MYYRLTYVIPSVRFFNCPLQLLDVFFFYHTWISHHQVRILFLSMSEPETTCIRISQICPIPMVITCQMRFKFGKIKQKFSFTSCTSCISYSIALWRIATMPDNAGIEYFHHKPHWMGLQLSSTDPESAFQIRNSDCQPLAHSSTKQGPGQDYLPKFQTEQLGDP